MLPAVSQAKKIKGAKTIYMFGVSVSIKDSTCCISTPHLVSGARLSKKGDMLLQRTGYTQQFKAYVESRYAGIHTCAVFFSTSPKTIEKQWERVHNSKQKDKTIKLIEIPLDDFKFQPASGAKSSESIPEKKEATI